MHLKFLAAIVVRLLLVAALKLQKLCEMPPERGPCSGVTLNYYYHPINGCELFLYGGCKGNANNFANKRDCHKKCHDKHPLHADRIVRCNCFDVYCDNLARVPLICQEICCTN